LSHAFFIVLKKNKNKNKNKNKIKRKINKRKNQMLGPKCSITTMASSSYSQQRNQRYGIYPIVFMQIFLGLLQII